MEFIIVDNQSFSLPQFNVELYQCVSPCHYSFELLVIFNDKINDKTLLIQGFLRGRGFLLDSLSLISQICCHKNWPCVMYLKKKKTLKKNFFRAKNNSGPFKWANVNKKCNIDLCFQKTQKIRKNYQRQLLRDVKWKKKCLVHCLWLSQGGKNTDPLVWIRLIQYLGLVILSLLQKKIIKLERFIHIHAE